MNFFPAADNLPNSSSSAASFTSSSVIFASADGKSTMVAVARTDDCLVGGGVVHLALEDEEVVFGLNVLASNPVGNSMESTSGTDGAETPIKLAFSV